MNCLEVRRRILADPALAMDLVAAHLSTCPSCSDFAAATARLDARLALELAVAVPRGLAEGILETTVVRLRRRRRILALAAAFAGAAIGGTFLLLRADDPMALAGIDFVIEEEANAILAAKPADHAALTRAAQALRIDLPPQLGDLRYIGTCPFGGMMAHHVIATTPQGKVTLLLLPDARIDEPQSARARGLRALVMPTGRGCVAMIADSSRSLERVRRMVLRA